MKRVKVVAEFRNENKLDFLSKGGLPADFAGLAASVQAVWC